MTDYDLCFILIIWSQRNWHDYTTASRGVDYGVKYIIINDLVNLKLPFLVSVVSNILNTGAL